MADDTHSVYAGHITARRLNTTSIDRQLKNIHDLLVVCGL